MKQLKVALFDLDGTLLDTEWQYTKIWGAIGRKYRPDVENLEYLIKGTTLKQIFENYFPGEALQREITEALNENERQMEYTFVAGAEAFVGHLRERGVKCAVVTSSNEEKMKSVGRKIAGFETMFDKVLTAEMFAASKPAPDCYLLGARTFGVDVSECVVFEDAFTGLQAGMSSGIYTIGLATCNTREAIEGKCHHVIDNFVGLTVEQVEEWMNAK